MRIDTDIDTEVLYDSLLISLDKSISTLQSNYYINKVCLAYSKMLCLEAVCFAILNNENIRCKIDEYRLLQNIEHQFFAHVDGASYFSQRDNHLRYDTWYDMSNDEHAEIFFKLFDTHEMPYIQIQKTDYSSNQHDRKNFGAPLTVTSGAIPAHDFDNEALKIVLVKHFSPPEYFVKGIEDILKYLITNNREKELQIINVCLQHQEFLLQDMIIVEKVVSISKVLNDENIDARIKLYVLHSLQVILDQQEKLHHKMGITPTITHVDLLT